MSGRRSTCPPDMAAQAPSLISDLTEGLQLACRFPRPSSSVGVCTDSKQQQSFQLGAAFRRSESSVDRHTLHE